MKENFSQKLGKLNIVIVSHIFSSGPALDLEDYLKHKVKSLLFIGHPFPYRSDKRNFYRLYKKGQLFREHKSLPWNLPEPFFYLKDALYTLYWVLSQKKKINLFVGSDNFSAYLGILLKRLGKVKDVIFYTIDYMPTRFKNPVMNFLYHHFDKTCLKECKVVWNVSPAIKEERKSRDKEESLANQILVPLGVWYKRIPKISFNKKNRYQLVFLGHLLEKQGLDVVLEGLPKIIETYHKTSLVILGTGEYEKSLKIKAKKLKIGKHVDFRGYVDDHTEVEKILTESTIGVAMYKPDTTSFTNWADPAKIKNYLASGLPVILTSVPPIAKVLERSRCGIIAEYKKDDFAKKVLEILTNTKQLQLHSKNARSFAKQFNWDNVFKKAIEETFISF